MRLNLRSRGQIDFVSGLFRAHTGHSDRRSHCRGPQGQARVLIRLPDNWNGKPVVAGASGTRSEFSGDFAWSDYLVQKGYAYVSAARDDADKEAPAYRLYEV
jgi:hypothetical protein